MFAGGERGIFFEDFSTPCSYQLSVTVLNSLSRRAIIPFDSGDSNFAHQPPESVGRLRSSPRLVGAVTHKAEHTRSSALRPSFSAKQLGRSSPPASSLRAPLRACPPWRACLACPDPDGERPHVPSAVEGSGVERTFRPCRSGSHSCPKPFSCHTCRKSPRKPNHCHRSDIALPQVLSLPHIQDSPGGTSCTTAIPLSRVQPTDARPPQEGLS